LCISFGVSLKNASFAVETSLKIETMEIALLQTDIAWGDKKVNLEQVEQLMNQHPGAQLYVLPEMFATGFMVGEGVVVEPADGDVHRWMVQTATQKGCAVAGSVAVEVDGRRHNRFYFVMPDGVTWHYDKRHLFTYAGEDRLYTKGEDRVVVRYGGMRILLQVCYDLRFPVFSRNRGDYDVAIYVANWPTARLFAWQTLLRARAIENQCFVLGVNRVGNDPANAYSGGTVALDPQGQTLAECRANEVDVARATLSLEALEQLRRSFPVMRDGDVFIL
jgi:carbon-nitrogen hydrolase family protein